MTISYSPVLRFRLNYIISNDIYRSNTIFDTPAILPIVALTGIVIKLTSTCNLIVNVVLMKRVKQYNKVMMARFMPKRA